MVRLIVGEGPRFPEFEEGHLGQNIVIGVVIGNMCSCFSLESSTFVLDKPKEAYWGRLGWMD